MPQQFRLQNFPASYSALTGVLSDTISRKEFSRSLITVGYPSRRKGKMHVGAWRAVILKNMALGYLKDDMSVSEYFLNLEGSEKATVSFLFGQAMTHWFAQKYMNMFYLVHVAGADEQYDLVDITAPIKLGAGELKQKGRPDFIGKCPLGFHVFESKGRSDKGSNNTINENLIASALAQVSRINQVNNIDPITRVAACFKFNEAGIFGDIRDPEPKLESYNLSFNESKAIKKYYNFFLDNPLSRVRVGKSVFHAIEIDEGLFYGVDENVLEYVRLRSAENLHKDSSIFYKYYNEVREKPDVDGYSLVANDGIALLEKNRLEILG